MVDASEEGVMSRDVKRASVNQCSNSKPMIDVASRLFQLRLVATANSAVASFLLFTA